MRGVEEYATKRKTITIYYLTISSETNGTKKKTRKTKINGDFRWQILTVQ